YNVPNMTNTSGMIGGWATVTTIDDFSGTIISTDWAAIGSTSDAFSNSYGSAIIPVAGYTNDAWGGTTNTTVTAGSAPSANSSTNSLRFAAATPASVNLSGTNTIASGGILVSSLVGSNNVAIMGGTLTSGNGVDLIVHQFNTSGALTIGS